MPNILLLGAGKSSTYLIDYLVAGAPKHKWHLVVADLDQELALSRIGRTFHASAVSLDIRDPESRRSRIETSDLVISLLPPALHESVAKDCLDLHKNLLTASYRDEGVRKMAPRIEKAGLLFLYEMGLDPGIDHMSSAKLIRSITGKGGVVHSFRSFCGGLSDPSANDNPWHYKVSWNPRNVVLAGKSGAVYKEKGRICRLTYEELFDQAKTVQVPGLGRLAYYPNRDSLEYMSLYQVEEAETFMRATLRFPDFCEGWNALVKLGLTDENKSLNTDRMPFARWATQNLRHRKGASSEEALQEFLKVHENSKVIRQLRYLGFLNGGLINQGKRSNAEVLQSVLENKLKMEPDDRDLIVMQHEIEFERRNIRTRLMATLKVIGENDHHTAMAKTVGLPLGIMAKLILTRKIALSGLLIPILPEIYQPVLRELDEWGIRFEEHFA